MTSNPNRSVNEGSALECSRSEGSAPGRSGSEGSALEGTIRGKVVAAFQPMHLELFNESHMHAGPRTDSHFKLVAVAAAFEGLNKVKRHQLVYRLLAEELSGPVHALALHLYTPGEWETQAVPASPLCAGSNKSQ